MTTTSATNKAGTDVRRADYVVPAVNIREEKDAYVLEADMPGVNKDSLEIMLEGCELTLVGRRVLDEQPGEVLLREQRSSDYRRVFEIAPTIDSAGIKASMNQGTLTLVLPKSEAVKPRRIQVST
jgi:HSP20 family molecular chaperone IbpA